MNLYFASTILILLIPYIQHDKQTNTSKRKKSSRLFKNRGLYLSNGGKIELSYSKVLHQKYDPKIEQEAQQMEILLSNDFEHMTLDELKFINNQFIELVKSVDHPSDLYTHKGLDEARDFLWYRIKEEEHKNDTLKIGDCFHTHWGYDQTNVEMYKIVGFTKSNKSAIIRQIGFKTVKGSEGFMSDSVQPDPDYEIKQKIVDEHTKLLKDTDKPLPDLKVKISRSTAWHPYKKEHIEIGEFHLRGSVYYAGDSKHLQNLYKIEKDGSTYRSWYA